ncbi:MAG TPA: formate--tetrahydrofolate ligase [Clostridia bacterium]|jgi:formate--tetrahydrofolate ligase|nr:formate--tetrahydrofolate ligase [Clostridia bacterium]HQA96360.1 formate--tetrahydrofolate ligase [Clostridia bacterium]HUM60625.1 formate--tetrahydrofolate ligase [Clostridia bacterium]
MNDIQIAQAASPKPIVEIARENGIPEDALMTYGPLIAKVNPVKLREMPEKGRLILVSAITPTTAGEGKTTVSISLADGLRAIGKRSMLALREPSMGPVFGMKGGATGGGHAQVLPMENINLHFTGDFHAITSANNLLCAMVDNHIQQGNQLGIDLRQVRVRRCMDMNDRQLRNIVGGLGGTGNGSPREDGFDITAASEVMASFCMAADLNDLKKRLGNIVVARTREGKNITCSQIGAQGAMAAMLRDAMMPNLVQTIDHTPALIHGGPFANIAHGCNSIAATRLAMKMADYVVTEAGFGADLGAEKFIDIKCRTSGLRPDVVVLVATIRALKHHGGVQKAELNLENIPALKAGMENLLAHIRNVKTVWNLPVVVAINHFVSDTQLEIETLQAAMDAEQVPCRFSDGWAKGGQGAKELAQAVAGLADQGLGSQMRFTYEDEASLTQKIEAVASKVYHAGSVNFSAQARKILAQLTEDGFGNYPVCIAKTQYSFSDNAALLGAPSGYELTIRDARLSGGAGFVVAFAGDIIAMPGLPKQPAALNIDVDNDGVISGIF